METLAGVVVGFLLGLVPLVLDHRRRAKAHLGALRSEIEMCVALARAYLQDNVQAPLYRLPVQAYTVSLGALLADGALSERQATALGEYYALVMQMNRGLDNTDHFHKVEHHQLRNAEYDRNRLKAAQLLPEHESRKYAAAIEAARD